MLLLRLYIDLILQGGPHPLPEHKAGPGPPDGPVQRRPSRTDEACVWLLGEFKSRPGDSWAFTYGGELCREE